ncbi:MAG TPA: F0F1 ATP synthase subunit alpha, partial [Denitromonas sp.]|nr:F0F1 ATP synthase subunit alpha [Denitromonas sp.]
APMSVADMAVTLYASNNGYFDGVEVSRVLAFEAALHQFIKTKYSALLEKIASTLNLDGDDEKTLAAAVTEFKKSWA